MNLTQLLWLLLPLLTPVSSFIRYKILNVVKLGDPWTSFECVISKGSGRILEWYVLKNGTDVEYYERLTDFMETNLGFELRNYDTERQYRQILIINHVTMKDAGVYICCVRNPIDTAHHKSHHTAHHDNPRMAHQRSPCRREYNNILIVVEYTIIEIDKLPNSPTIMLRMEISYSKSSYTSPIFECEYADGWKTMEGSKCEVGYVGEILMWVCSLMRRFQGDDDVPGKCEVYFQDRDNMKGWMVKTLALKPEAEVVYVKEGGTLNESCSTMLNQPMNWSHHLPPTSSQTANDNYRAWIPIDSRYIQESASKDKHARISTLVIPNVGASNVGLYKCAHQSKSNQELIERLIKVSVINFKKEEGEGESHDFLKGGAETFSSSTSQVLFLSLFLYIFTKF